MNNLIPKNSPKGFIVSHSKQGYLLVSYRTTGMGCLLLLNLTWLILWTVVCLLLIIEIIEPGQLVDIKLIALLFFFIILEFLMIARTLWFFGGVRQYEFQGERLIVSQKLWFVEQQSKISKSKIQGIQQIKDGGRRYNSFPSWGLKLDTQDSKAYKILRRQPIEKSAWLGKLIADWAGVDYSAAQYRSRKIWTWRIGR